MKRVLFAAVLISITLFAAPGRREPEAKLFHSAYIYYGANAGRVEVHAAQELARDLEKVFGFSPRVEPEQEQRGGGSGRAKAAVFYVGTAESHVQIQALVKKGIISVSALDPGPEAFVIRALPETGEVIIAGCDPRGALYGVYEYSRRFLGIDPFEYWTGKTPARLSGLEIPEASIREKPPAFKLRGYFDNDSDMLANFTGKKLIIEFELWKEMIDSLARLRYNFIDPFDTMGRAEFWNWPYYAKIFPGYKTDLELLNQIIDYAHEKGMMVQVSTSLGWEFHHLPYEHKCLSLHHQDWMNSYRYLLGNTPVGRADIYYHSPRDPWWDRPYRCRYEKALGIDSGRLHSRLLNDLEKLIREHNPGARVFCLFWSDGKSQWKRGSFQPSGMIDMVWADNGYGIFPDWPGDFRGHKFGIYIHAGYWRNHVLQDPYPSRIKESTLEAFRRGLTEYYFVNGQDFKHFILNLEACGRAAWDPQGFDSEKFYAEWAGRYFGKAGPLTMESLKSLHRASELAGGFANITMETSVALRTMNYRVPYCKNRSYMAPALESAQKSLELAGRAAALAPENAREIFNDQVLFPATIYLANLKLHRSVTGAADAKCEMLNPSAPPGKKIQARRRLKQFKSQAPAELQELRRLLEQGSGWEKWEGWSRPENFRKYQPPPTVEELKTALRRF